MEEQHFFSEIPNLYLNPTLIVVCLLAFLSIIYLTKRKRKLNLPPGPPAVPILGSIPWIDRKNPVKSLASWTKDYGPIVTYYIGSRRSVLVNDAKLARELLIKHADVFSQRADILAARMNWGVEGEKTTLYNQQYLTYLALENGIAWKTHRRWIVTGLRHFGLGKRSIEEQISTEADKLCHEIDQESGKFFPKKYIENAVSNIICSISFGKRYEYDDSKFQGLLEDVNAFFSYSHFGRIEELLPLIMKLFVKRRQHVANIIEFFNSHMKEHKKNFDKNNIRDLIDMLLLQSEQESVEEEQTLSRLGKSSAVNKTDDVESLWRAILMIFLAGTDTSTSTILWFLQYMVCYPAIQQRIQQEIDTATGKERSLTSGDKLKVPYFEATICEVQRLSNVAPALLAHCTSADFVVNGYDIPANTNFNLNLTSIHTDPKYWENPLEFKPERFLDDDEAMFVKQEAFMPFGLGRRACLGENLAKMELYIFLSRLLQRYDFELPEGVPQPSFEPITGITQCPQYYEIIATPR
ncbi:cytochrome P450 2J5-like [Antedon mediterranea]|uniref:cytochrome P450 2J5-like n=1 Tax=Antedon mediterranea TaxID=105859 RepID=UPI003AF5C5C7